MLAWTRTVLVTAAVAALIVRTADSGFERGASITLAAGGLALFALAAWRRRRTLAGADPAAPAGGTFAGLLGGVAALVVAGVVVIL